MSFKDVPGHILKTVSWGGYQLHHACGIAHHTVILFLIPPLIPGGGCGHPEGHPGSGDGPAGDRPAPDPQRDGASGRVSLGSCWQARYKVGEVMLGA